MRLESMRAVVTGAGSGIGLATAQLMIREGARVAALDLSPPVPAPDGALVPVAADVTDGESMQRAAEEAAEALGGIDIVVCNAGISSVGTVEDNDDAEWHRVLDLNVVGVARTARAFLPHLRRSPNPAIVTTASVVAEVGLPSRACYGASKGAVKALTLAMAADCLADGIRVNCVCPGTIDTPWVERLLTRSGDAEAMRAQLVARQPIGRLGTAEEVAEAIVYLASPAAGYVTGTALVLDGGITGVSVPPR